MVSSMESSPRITGNVSIVIVAPVILPSDLRPFRSRTVHFHRHFGGSLIAERLTNAMAVFRQATRQRFPISGRG
jgi:hypothetical protein